MLHHFRWSKKFTHETCIRKHLSKINKKIWKHLHQSLSKLHRWFQLLSKLHTLLLELMILKTNWNWQENNMGWKLNWFLAHSGEEKFSHRQLFSAIKLVDSQHIIFVYYTDVWRTFLLSCWSFLFAVWMDNSINSECGRCGDHFNIRVVETAERCSSISLPVALSAKSRARARSAFQMFQTIFDDCLLMIPSRTIYSDSHNGMYRERNVKPPRILDNCCIYMLVDPGQ